MKTKSSRNSAIIVYSLLVAFVLFFLFTGTNEIELLSSYFSKLIDINVTISIGYSALLAAVSSFANHNNRQSNDTKNSFMTFIHTTVLFVLANIVLVITTFLMNDSYDPFFGRFIITLFVAILVIYSHSLLVNVKKMMY